MNILFAMGIPTTTDDRGYLLWFSQNWTVLVLPTLAFSALVIAWLVRKVRDWNVATPSSPPGEQTQSMDLSAQPKPPPSASNPETNVEWPFGPQLYAGSESGL